MQVYLVINKYLWKYLCNILRAILVGNLFLVSCQHHCHDQNCTKLKNVILVTGNCYNWAHCKYWQFSDWQTILALQQILTGSACTYHFWNFCCMYSMWSCQFGGWNFFTSCPQMWCHQNFHTYIGICSLRLSVFLGVLSVISGSANLSLWSVFFSQISIFHMGCITDLQHP